MKLPAEIASLDAAQKDALILSLLERIAEFEVQVRELAAAGRTNSRNSSKPPSSDGYDKPAPKSTRRKGRRKPGGQKGHKGHTLKRSEQPDHVIVHDPSHCKRCGCSLADSAVVDVRRRQVHDLPPVRLEVSEHQALIRHCPCCRARCQAPFPAGVDQPLQYGERIRSMATYLGQYQMLPYARLREAFADLFGVSLSEGTLDGIYRRAGDALEGFDQQVIDALIASEHVHFDESGMRVGGNLQWLHVASTDTLTHYLMHARRGREAMEEMGVLGNFSGYAVHDHWSSYFSFDEQLHVLCNAHHLRELIAAHENHEQQWAGELVRCLVDARREVDKARAAGKPWLSERRIDHHEERYDRILQDGIRELPPPPPSSGTRGRKKQHKVKNLHDRLVNHKPEVLAFVYDFSLPFDNNQAERDVRMAKVKQKISGSFRSMRGAVDFARIRGYISTARKQKRNILGVLEALFAGRPFDPAAA